MEASSGTPVDQGDDSDEHLGRSCREEGRGHARRAEPRDNRAKHEDGGHGEVDPVVLPPSPMMPSAPIARIRKSTVPTAAQTPRR